MSEHVLIVRSIIADPEKRAKFNTWAETNFPHFCQEFGAKIGRRSWSKTDPAVHNSVYIFASEEAYQKAVDEKVPAVKALVDTEWPDVHRTREVFELTQQVIA